MAFASHCYLVPSPSFATSKVERTCWTPQATMTTTLPQPPIRALPMPIYCYSIMGTQRKSRTQGWRDQGGFSLLQSEKEAIACTELYMLQRNELLPKLRKQMEREPMLNDEHVQYKSSQKEHRCFAFIHQAMETMWRQIMNVEKAVQWTLRSAAMNKSGQSAKGHRT